MLVVVYLVMVRWSYNTCHRFWLLLIASALTAAFNAGYEWLSHYHCLVVTALVIRVLPPLEACWYALPQRRDYQAALSLFAVAYFAAGFKPDATAWDYLTVRNLATLSTTAVCLCVTISTWRYAEPFFRRHLILQTCWMTLHSVFSLLVSWYAPFRLAARWAYIAGATAIAVNYLRVPAAAVAVEPDRHLPSPH
jgi:hypothetical protein